MIHAHVDTDSQDCDGRISRTYVSQPGGLEDDDAIKEWVLSMNVSFHSPTNIDITANGFGVYEETEEGYCRTEVRWCEDPTCKDTKPTYRDHRAESMGY